MYNGSKVVHTLVSKSIRICLLLIGLYPMTPLSAQIQLPQAGAPTGSLPAPSRRPPPPPSTSKQPVFQQGLLPAATAVPTNQVADVATDLGPKDVNVDTVLAKFMETQGDFSAFGDMEVRTTNGTSKVDYQHFPFTLSILDGRIRTELDLRNVPKKLDGSGGLSALRQIGIGRIVSVTLPELRSTHVIFPSAESYVAKPLAIEDTPTAMQIAKRLVGREHLNGKPYDKYQCNLDFMSGERVPVEIWQVPGTADKAVFLRIRQKGSSVTVRFRVIRPGKVPEELFDTPKEFSKHPDLGYLMQAASARYEASQTGRAVRRGSGITRPSPGGSFLNQRR